MKALVLTAFMLLSTQVAANEVTEAIGFVDSFEVPSICDPSSYVPSLEGVTVKWKTVFGEEFPGPKNHKKEQFVPKRGYIGIRFYTGGVKDTGGITTIELTKNSGTRLGAISECPGHFAVPDECKMLWGIGGGILWSTEDADSACQLKAKTTYYFNLTFTDGTDPDTDTCDEDKCYTDLRVSNP